MEIPTKIKHAASVMAFSAAAGLTAASTYVPWKLGSTRGLGPPLFTYEGIGVYGPWHFPYWYFKFGADIPVALSGGKVIIMACVALGAFAAYKIYTHGSTSFGKREWGDRDYAKKKNLLHPEPKGIVLGAWSDGTLMCDDSDVSVAVTGASRSGKTVSSVFPTLLSWQRSAVITDPSGELYEGTSRWRGTLGPAPYLDYNDPNSARKNPWDEIRKGTLQETGDIQTLVDILMDPGSDKRQRPSYWEKDGALFYTQVIRHMLMALPAHQHNFGELRARVGRLQALLDGMMASEDSDIRDIAARFDSMNPDQKQGVESEAGTALKLWADPLVRKLTSSSEFSLSDLVCGDLPFTLYIRNSLDQADRLMPLTRMLVQQLTSLISSVQYATDGREKKHKLLCLYEEFPELGRLGTIQRHLANGAKYGFRFMLIMQSKASVEDNYGRYSTILKNCPIQVVFPSTSAEDNENLSVLIGTGEELRETIQKGRGGLFAKHTPDVKSYTTHRRRLLDPGEIRALPDDEQFVIITPGKPMRTKKLRWFDHPIFAARGDNIRAGATPPGQHPDFGHDPAPPPAPPAPPPPPTAPLPLPALSQDEPRTKVSLRLPEKLLADIDEVCKTTGQPRSDVVSEMLAAVKFVHD